jgi:N-acetylglucosamine repressor
MEAFFTQYDIGINRDTQKEANLSLVIRALHADPLATRTSLSRSTGLKQAAITKIVQRLQDWGLVSETSEQKSALGRKPIGLKLNAERYLLGAVRINREYLSCGIYDISGKLHALLQRKNHPEKGAQAALSALESLVAQALARTPVMALGAALPGPFNARTGRITLMSGFPGWADLDIKSSLERASGVPVFLEHDANCGALAELWHGDHRRDENLLYVVCDRGVGAGLIVKGAIYHGASGYSGEIGHASINFAGPLCECGNRGCLELYASSEVLRETYALSRLTGGGAPLAADEILAMSRAGDCAAQEAYARVSGHLAFGIAGLINTLNPDCVVFADRMVEGGPVFLQTVESVLKRHLMPEIFSSLKISVNQLPGDPMLLGASVVALDNLLMRPTAAFGGAPGA